MFDGDTVFALSLGDHQADINILGVAAAEALAEAILRAVSWRRPSVASLVWGKAG